MKDLNCSSLPYRILANSWPIQNPRQFELTSDLLHLPDRKKSIVNNEATRNSDFVFHYPDSSKSTFFLAPFSSRLDKNNLTFTAEFSTSIRVRIGVLHLGVIRLFPEMFHGETDTCPQDDMVTLWRLYCRMAVMPSHGNRTQLFGGGKASVYSVQRTEPLHLCFCSTSSRRRLCDWKSDFYVRQIIAVVLPLSWNSYPKMNRLHKNWRLQNLVTHSAHENITRA